MNIPSKLLINFIMIINNLGGILLRFSKKKFFYYIFIIICFLGFTSSFFLQLTYYHFSPDKVKENIAFLSSDEFNGRLTGTYGNYKASQLIEDTFKKYKLIPLNNNYRESFNVITIATTSEKAKLNIKDSNGNIIENYNYGTDFKEDMSNCRTSSAVFSKKDSIIILSTSFIITSNNKKYLFYIDSSNNLNFRSSFNKDSIYEFSLAITNQVYNDILNNLKNNNTVEIDLPYRLYPSKTDNIIGVIKGSHSNISPLIISAHFDHVGSDAIGNCYGGALDNASGTSFLMELCKNISSLPKPKMDIIFVGFTGEEFGLLGSKEFAKENMSLIKNSKVINLDMIGAKDVPLILMCGENTSNSSLASDFEKYCTKYNIDYKIKYQNSSDHASFSSNGIDALTLCHGDFSRIHTPNDTVKYIDTTAINDVYSIVKDEIFNSAYSPIIIFFYNTNITLFFLITFMTLIFIPKYKNTILKQISASIKS